MQELYCTLHSSPGDHWAAGLRIDPFLGAAKQGMATASSVVQPGNPQIFDDG